MWGKGIFFPGARIFLVATNSVVAASSDYSRETMLSFRTRGYNGYALQYSPFFDNKLAVATAANFGLVGNGRLYILDISANGSVGNPIHWDTQDGLFDVAWSECHENQVVAASGDGLLKLFDTTVGQLPVRHWHEHSREVFCVNWNMIDKQTFLSSSWDGCIKIWLPVRQDSVQTLGLANAVPEAVRSIDTRPPLSHRKGVHHQSSTIDCIYSASFSPHLPSTIVSCNGGLRIHVWDTRQKNGLQLDYIAHGGLEALSCDWNKYRPYVVASGGTDKSVRTWDLRKIDRVVPGVRGPTPLAELRGHQYAVRRVQWLPHDPHELQSVSYDMTCRIWRDDHQKVSRTFSRHSEFVIGCDYSLWGEPGWTATTAWDEMVYVWDTKRL